MDAEASADLFARMMTEILGYERFVSAGGDHGAIITQALARKHPELLLGIHLTDVGYPDQSTDFSTLSPAEIEMAQWVQQWFMEEGIGVNMIMATKPQTLAYGLNDSPVGLAAWMLDHDDRSRALIGRVFDGQTEGLTRDDILDNITLYWVTNTAVSSSRLYWDTTQTATSGFFDPRGIKIPVAVTVFPDEIYAAPKTWAERSYPKLIYFSKLEKGGHFAAWEQPEVFSREMRSAFRSLR
jgi:pimeloyl-ACP methyl ester carboxylesterase